MWKYVYKLNIFATKVAIKIGFIYWRSIIQLNYTSWWSSLPQSASSASPCAISNWLKWLCRATHILTRRLCTEGSPVNYKRIQQTYFQFLVQQMLQLLALSAIRCLFYTIVLPWAIEVVPCWRQSFRFLLRSLLFKWFLVVHLTHVV